jgi:hypothetical protein
VTGTIQGFIRVHMNILNPVSIRRSTASSLRDVLSRALDYSSAAANDGSSTLIVNIPQDRTTLVNVTRFVICGVQTSVGKFGVCCVIAAL